jgi:hypothetical protein
MKFLRTSSTGRLLATIVGLIMAIAAGTAIAVAATNSSPVPKAEPLADALHRALGASPVKGISADISFTNGLISSADFTGDHADPLLQGASGRLWLSAHELRLELQGTNGDAQVVINRRSFWISDPASSTVYEGTLPADISSSASTNSASASKNSADQGVPSIAEIQSDITRLLNRVTLGGAHTSDPEDVAGRPAYSVRISPRHSGGELGKLQLAWDAVRGIPLDIAVYSSTSTSTSPGPVLELKASNISYGRVSPSVFNLHLTRGYKVVKVSGAAQQSAASKALKKGKAKHADVSGVAAVASHVPFRLVAPTSAVGLPRHGVTLLSWGGTPAALVTYGQGLGAIAVIEQKATAASSSTSSSQGQGSNLSLPTVSIKGATGQELDTALGTMVRFTRGGVSFTVIGSVTPYAAERAARALTP